MIKIGQNNCVKRTASSEFKVMPRDRVSKIPFNMQMCLLSWDLSLDFMQCLDQLKFLAYFLGVEHEEGRNADGRRPIFYVN